MLILLAILPVHVDCEIYLAVRRREANENNTSERGDLSSEFVRRPAVQSV